MPTIDKRFLFKLILALFAAAGVLVTAHTVQARRIPAALKVQADRAAEGGKADMAVHYLRQYLEFQPDDADSLVGLADLLKKRGVSPRGRSELLFLYDRVLRLDPDRHPIRRDALALALEMGRNPDAVTHAQALLKAFPTEAGLWRRLGIAQTGLNDKSAARAAFEAAVAHAPDEMIGYQQLAELQWRSLDDPEAARATLDRMVAAVPQNPEAFLVRARFEMFRVREAAAQAADRTDTSSASADLRRVLELDPEHAEAALLLSEIMERRRNVPAAHALLREAVTLYPRDLRLVRALSWLELIRGNAAAAVAVLEDALKVVPRDQGVDLMVPLADLLVEQGDAVRTADLLNQLEARQAPPTRVKYLKARIAMREQKWAEAVAMLEALRRESVNLPGLEVQLNLLEAACFQKVGDPGEEKKAYDRVTYTDRNNVTAQVGLGNLYLNQGQWKDAEEQYDKAIQSPFATGAVVAQWVKLKGQLLLAAPPAPGAWAALDAALAPGTPERPTLAARFGRGSSEPAVLRGELLQMQGRHADAARLLRGEAARRPGDPRLWAALALTAADAGGVAAGLAVVDEAQAAAGDCADLRIVRAALYAREPGRVRPIDPLAANIENWPENEQLRLLSGLVEVYDQLGDRAGVVRALARIAARQPAAAAIWAKLHECAAPDDPTRAAAARAALAKLEGEGGPSVLLCDARVAPAADAAAAAARLTAAFGETPNRVDACLALARLKRFAGDEAAAAALAERAFVLEPTRYEGAEALVGHLAAAGPADRLAQLLRRLAADPRWAGEPFRRMVGHVLPTLPGPAAVAVLDVCRPLVDRDPNGPPWVADWAAALKQPDAPALLAAATARVGATGDDWLRRALAASKEDAAAGPQVIAAAKLKLTPQAHADLVAAFADTAAGSTFVPAATTPEEKRLLARARLAVKLSRGLYADAGKLLEEYLAGADAAPADADWARRNLAMICATGGTPADRERAMALLRQVTTAGATAPAELRATAGTLASLARYLDGGDRRGVLKKAQDALEAVYKQSAAPADLFALSQLYRASGDRADSRRCLNALLNRQTADENRKDPSYVFYLTAALEELLEDDREDAIAAARTFARELRVVRAADFKSVSVLARLECRDGRPEAGLAAAEDYARLADNSAGDYLARSAQIAELLDALSRMPTVRGTPAGHKITDAAVERFAALVPNRPEAIVGAAGALAADGRTAAAFECIDRLGRYLPARLRASAGLAVVRSGAVTDRQAETVRQWLDACLADDPDSTPLALNRAEFLARRGHTPEAAAAFQRAIDKEPKNVVALNNLAWLLAADKDTAERALELVTRATREAGLTGELLDTRARVRITLRQFAEAERDLTEALANEQTPLRWFHKAVLSATRTPPNTDEAVKAFAEARRRGLDPRGIHPADLPTYRVLEAGGKK
jgi:tetratricopeptide (TPR) repeat protein